MGTWTILCRRYQSCLHAHARCDGSAAASRRRGESVVLRRARGRFRGRSLIENGISAPIIVPHIVLSIAIYGLFSRLGLIGEWYGVAVAHTVLALPFVVIVLLAGLRDFDANLELAARGLGAGRLAAVRTVTLPILAPSVYSAAFLAFITSFDELVVAMFISGANMTLPKKMFDNILSEIEPTVAAVSALQIVLISVLLVLGTRLRRPATAPMVR